MADPFAQLVNAAQQLVIGAGNSIGPVLGNTDAMDAAAVERLLASLGYQIPAPLPGGPGTPAGGAGGGAGRPGGRTGGRTGGLPGGPGTGSGGRTGGPVGAPPGGPLPINPSALGGRPGLFSRMKGKLTDIQRSIARSVSTPRAGAAALMPSATTGIKLPFDKRFSGNILNPPTPKDGSIVGLFMLWQGKIMIQKRAVAPDTISCPTGFLEGGETFEEAALRELQEEAQFDPVPDSDTLTLFHRTQHPDTSGNLVDVAFYYSLVDRGEQVTTAGPETGSAGEVDTGYDFTDISGAEVREPGTGHAWIGADDLERYVEEELGGISGENPMFAEAVEKFMEIQDEAFGRAIDDINMSADIPAWASEYFSISSELPECKDAKIIGPDCLARAVHRDIMVAEQYKNSLRLRKKPDAALKTYNEKASEYAALKKKTSRTDDENKKMGDLERELESGYPDRVVHIRKAADGMIHEFTVPNPYRALAYREDRRKPVSFADPAGYRGSAKDPGRLMYDKNIKLLNELAPSALIADSAMATSLLESLWFCGSNPTVSNDPRCYPARILGELREWQANKDQDKRGRHAKDVIDADSSWGVTKQLMTALENAVAGATEFPFIEVRTGIKKNATKVAVAAAPTPPGGGPPPPGSPLPGPPLPSPPLPGPPPGSLPPVSTGGIITPFLLGGFNPLIPLLPTRLGGP